MSHQTICCFPSCESFRFEDCSEGGLFYIKGSIASMGGSEIFSCWLLWKTVMDLLTDFINAWTWPKSFWALRRSYHYSGWFLVYFHLDWIDYSKSLMMFHSLARISSMSYMKLDYWHDCNFAFQYCVTHSCTS